MYQLCIGIMQSIGALLVAGLRGLKFPEVARRSYMIYRTLNVLRQPSTQRRWTTLMSLLVAIDKSQFYKWPSCILSAIGIRLKPSKVSDFHIFAQNRFLQVSQLTTYFKVKQFLSYFIYWRCWWRERFVQDRYKWRNRSTRVWLNRKRKSWWVTNEHVQTN